MSQTILFQCGEASDCVYSTYVADEASTATLIRRMEALGYTIIEVSPPNARWVPQRSENQAHARHESGYSVTCRWTVGR